MTFLGEKELLGNFRSKVGMPLLLCDVRKMDHLVKWMAAVDSGRSNLENEYGAVP